MRRVLAHALLGGEFWGGWRAIRGVVVIVVVTYSKDGREEVVWRLGEIGVLCKAYYGFVAVYVGVRNASTVRLTAALVHRYGSSGELEDLLLIKMQAYSCRGHPKGQFPKVWDGGMMWWWPVAVVQVGCLTSPPSHQLEGRTLINRRPIFFDTCLPQTRRCFWATYIQYSLDVLYRFSYPSIDHHADPPHRARG